jgi:hypothetical protein
MFKVLELRNFRGFEEARVTGLSRLNIFTGLNGSGKTSILEAAFLISAAANASLAASLYGFRGEREWNSSVDRPFRSLFRNLDPETFPNIIASRSDHLKGSKKYGRELTIRPTYSLGEGQTTTDQSKILKGVTFDFSGPSGRASNTWGWNFPDKPPSTIINVKPELGGKLTNNPDLIHAQFVSPYVRDIFPTDHQLLTQLITERRSQEAVQALRHLIPELVALHPLSESGVPVILADVGGTVLLPLALLGSGAANCLRILLPSLLRENGLILIDEFEDGIHHSLLAPILEIVFNLARKRNNQLYISTHSKEFLTQVITLTSNGDEKDIAFYRLGRLGLKGLIPRFSVEEAESLLESNLDLR